ncbi:MAG: fluoride efflux transporter CrcB [Myxococcota bacterium]
MTATRLWWIFVAGGFGSAARYLLSGFVLERLGTAFPFGTLAVNLIGSFLLSALVHVALATELVSPTLRIALATGFLGGFTTYSTFSHETFVLLQEGAWAQGSLNVTVTVVGCLTACLLGQAAGRWLAGG